MRTVPTQHLDEHSRGPAVQVRERKALKENEQMEAEAQPASLGVLVTL